MQSRGAELAESAAVPEQLAALLLHVCLNLDAHAEWVGTGSEAARLEHAGLIGAAAHYRAIAEAALRAAGYLRTLRELPVAPHDPGRQDGPTFLRWMQRKIELQRALAGLLQEHARAAEAALLQEMALYSAT